MRKVKSFSLEEEVIEAIEKIPKNDRSRKINQILYKALVLKKDNNDMVNRSQLKELVKDVMQEIPGPNPENNVEKEKKAQRALNNILNNR